MSVTAHPNNESANLSGGTAVRGHAIERRVAGKRAASMPRTLILEHTDLVRRIAYRLVRVLPSNVVDIEDLIQAGMVGLLEALCRYAAVKGASFETYGGIRIRGTMLDFVRKGNRAPRRLPRQLREIAAATRRLENDTGRAARPADLAATIGLSIEQYHDILHDVETGQTVSLDAMKANDSHWSSNGLRDNGADLADDLAQRQLRQVLAAAIDALPERERIVLMFYYDEELCLREIGNRLGLSESRVCQIHRRAIERLRAMMQRWMESGGAVRRALTSGRRA